MGGTRPRSFARATHFARATQGDPFACWPRIPYADGVSVRREHLVLDAAPDGATLTAALCVREVRRLLPRDAEAAHDDHEPYDHTMHPVRFLRPSPNDGQ